MRLGGGVGGIVSIAGAGREVPGAGEALVSDASPRPLIWVACKARKIVPNRTTLDIATIMAAENLRRYEVVLILASAAVADVLGVHEKHEQASKVMEPHYCYVLAPTTLFFGAVTRPLFSVLGKLREPHDNIWKDSVFSPSAAPLLRQDTKDDLPRVVASNQTRTDNCEALSSWKVIRKALY